MLFLGAAALLIARDNPFEPTQLAPQTIVSSNVIEAPPPFEPTKITFDSDARELLGITLTYKSVDGSIKQKQVDFNNSFEWRRPFLLTTTAADEPQEAKNIEIAVANKTAQAAPLADPTNASTAAQNADLPAMSTASDSAKTTSQKDERKNIVEPDPPLLASEKLLDLVEIKVFENRIDLITKDEKMRDFTIAKPDKIVIDFRRGGLRFRSTTKPLAAGPLAATTIGAHDGYYRVVLELGGSYHYALRTTGAGYRITLK